MSDASHRALSQLFLIIAIAEFSDENRCCRTQRSIRRPQKLNFATASTNSYKCVLPLLSKGSSMAVSLRQFPVPPRDSGECGECTVCCDVIGVSELGKPYYARCSHLGSRCEIFGKPERPKPCSTWRCAYHLGFLGDREEYRPDKLGVVLNIEEHGDKKSIRISAYESTPGAFEKNAERLKHVIRRIQSHGNLKNLKWNQISLTLIPWGADMNCGFPISNKYAPYESPPNSPVSVDPVAGVATFNGPIRPILLPASR